MLRAYGFAPAPVSEPQRMAQQIKPDSIKLLSASEIKRVEAQVQADLAPKECLQAGPFDEVQAVALRKALESALPSGSWQMEEGKLPARWIVYMGKYATAELLAKKRTELNGMGIKSESVSNPALEMGLSLGGFETEAAAKAELSRLGPKGIRTAKVVQEREEGTASVLKLPALTEMLRAKLTDLKPALAGRSFKNCS
ncbi:SPOR domain-containing protein [Rhodoferax sp.]|uniref:SPOR domain-containing protein n=1 Tax=Rhodoferax sp. TaxID=50421 RepID=UPI002ACD8EC7|nr:SPOR domain-containing protein [Rhodoferax sp.]MDZ7920983.1 SPOR domain-containing protein [Rhodoferax sp.]